MTLPDSPSTLDRIDSMIIKPAPSHRLRISEALWRRLRAHHLAPGKRREAISLAFGHSVTDEDGHVLIVLAREDGLLLFDDDCYEHRSYGAAVLRRDVRGQALWQAVQQGWTAVVDIHDHHFASKAAFSSIDDRDDQATHDFFVGTLPSFAAGGRVPVAAALLLAQDEAQARLVAHDQEGTWGQAMRIGVVGAGGLAVPSIDDDDPRNPAPSGSDDVRMSEERLVRHHGVVPMAVQRRLAGLHVAVVGCGGTGSVAAEALARLGVGTMTLVDDDRVEASNLNRLQGVQARDIGSFKAEALARHLRSVVPELDVRTCVSKAHTEPARSMLPRADVLFGCLDNAESRWWMNRLSLQYLQPWFDVGVVIDPAEQPTFMSRLNTVIPAAGPCGHCSPMEFFPRSRPEVFLDERTLRAQRAASYVRGVPSSVGDPSLYGLNLAAVGLAVQEFVSWSCGRPVAHSLVQVLPQTVMQRLELGVFGGRAAEDCPLCHVLLGMASQIDLPAEAPEALGDPTAKDPLAVELATFLGDAAESDHGDHVEAESPHN